MRWFAVRVKSRHEKAVAQHLELRGFASFTPLYVAIHQWTDRERTLHLPLFPGYVFSKFSATSLLQVVNTPGVIDVVRCGNSLAPIDDGEIHGLQQVMDSGYEAEPAVYIETGQPVTITSGPLAGVRGTVVRQKSGFKLVVSVTLLQRSIQVEVSRGAVEGSGAVPGKPVGAAVTSTTETAA